jgi:hypothetical protein
MMRLMVTARDWSPPAMALSTHTPPALRNAWATCLTAFDSPPEVHQWMTSAFGAAALAGALPSTILSAPAAAHNHAQAAARLRDLTILSPFSAMFFWHVWKRYHWLCRTIAPGHFTVKLNLRIVIVEGISACFGQQAASTAWWKKAHTVFVIV